jgi:ATP-dependent RNA helicase DeaD
MDMTFSELGLIPPLVDAITTLGYEVPTPIQAQAIGLMLAKRDVIGQAQTGTGKTAAFALPLLQQIDPKKPQVQALILTPTRELTIQVAEAVYRYGKNLQIQVLPIYGGVGYGKQINKLESGVQVVVGTPGRVMDLMRKGTLNLEHVRHLVLDEADEMLNMGFLEDVEWILQQIPKERQTALFSATMSHEVRRLAEHYMHDAKEILIAASAMNVPKIEQRVYVIAPYQKLEALTRLLDTEDITSVLIFTRTKTGAAELTEALQARGYAADALHGDLAQQGREIVIRKLRKGTVNIVVATDVAARGIDIDNISHVINYDLPSDIEYYVHRVGRTGRAGRTGVAITFATQRELRMISTIERTLKIKLERARLPTEKDVAANRSATLAEAIQTGLANETPRAYYQLISQLADDYSIEQVAAAALRLYDESLQPRAAALSGQQPVLESASTTPSYEFDDQDENEARVKLFISKGSRAGIRVNDIVGAIANECGIPGREIGPVTVHGGFSFAEIPARHQRKVISKMANTTMRGIHVTIGIARPSNEEES